MCVQALPLLLLLACATAVSGDSPADKADAALRALARRVQCPGADGVPMPCPNRTSDAPVFHLHIAKVHARHFNVTSTPTHAQLRTAETRTPVGRWSNLPSSSLSLSLLFRVARAQVQIHSNPSVEPVSGDRSADCFRSRSSRRRTPAALPPAHRTRS